MDRGIFVLVGGLKNIAAFPHATYRKMGRKSTPASLLTLEFGLPFFQERFYAFPVIFRFGGNLLDDGFIIEDRSQVRGEGLGQRPLDESDRLRRRFGNSCCERHGF